MDIVTIQNLKKYFGEGAGQVKALDGITLSIEKGKFTAIVGASGSGKTTLLNSIGGLHRPTEGEIAVDGINLAELSEEQLTVFRRRKVGFVFQDYNLVPELTVKENILFPLALDDSAPDKVFFHKITKFLGLDDTLSEQRNTRPLFTEGIVDFAQISAAHLRHIDQSHHLCYNTFNYT